MTEKQAYVFKHLQSGDICVFPSEVSARYWLRSYVFQNDETAIRDDHAISWDTFVSLFERGEGDEIPADDMVRFLFVEQWGREHRLSYFQPVSDDSIARVERYLASILPQLQDVCRCKAFGLLKPEMRQDLRTLYAGYTTFLEEKHLYEPRYRNPVNVLGARYRILFSDVLPGHSRILSLLHDSSVKAFPSPAGKFGGIISYANHVQEVRETLRETKRLLDMGVPMDDIVISTANDEQMLPCLESLAPLYDVPLSFRFGKSPLSHPAGRFFKCLQDIYVNEFNLGDMKAFLLDIALPWSDTQTNLAHRFVQEAVRRSIDQGSLGRDDPWLLGLRNRELMDWYAEFKNFIIAINTTDTVDGLLERLHAFQDHYFLSGGWLGFPGEEVYTFCMDALEKMRVSMELCSVTRHISVLSLFITYLSKRLYVPQAPSPDSGIHVYRWTDANTLDIPHHFFLSMDWKSTQTIDKPLDCLPDTIIGAGRGEEDLTEANLLLAASGGSVVSYHVRDYGGDHRAPSLFSRKIESPVSEDRYQDERILWKHGTVTGRATWFQRLSRESSRHVRGTMTDYTAPDNPFRADLLLQREKGLGVSPTSLDLFVLCPFAWSCKYVFGVTEMEFLVDLVDAKTVGNMLHSAYRKFFDSVGRFDVGNMESYRALLGTCFDESMRETYGDDGPDPAGRVWITNFYRDACMRILEAERILFEGTATYKTEQELTAKWDSLLSLQGRIDRIVDMGDGTMAVIDYKTGKAPFSMTGSGKDPRELEDKFVSLQLPLYRTLVHSSVGKDVSWAGYYVIKDGKYLAIWDKDKVGNRDAGERKMQRCLSALADAVRSGCFPATPSKASCGGCAYRFACRRRFSAQ